MNWLKYLGLLSQIAPLLERAAQVRAGESVSFSGLRIRVAGKRLVIRGVIEHETTERV